jgi:hypothetical protein
MKGGKRYLTPVVFLPQTYNLYVTTSTTSDKLQLKDILPNACPALLKNVKVRYWFPCVYCLPSAHSSHLTRLSRFEKRKC